MLLSYSFSRFSDVTNRSDTRHEVCERVVVERSRGQRTAACEKSQLTETTKGFAPAIMAQPTAYAYRDIGWQDHCFSVHQWVFRTKNFVNNKKAIHTCFSIIPFISLLPATLTRRFLPKPSLGLRIGHYAGYG
jgi:hypothetical protein